MPKIAAVVTQLNRHHTKVREYRLTSSFPPDLSLKNENRENTGLNKLHILLDRENKEISHSVNASKPSC